MANRSDEKIKRIVYTALTVAIICVATVTVSIPVGIGYIHPGDAFVVAAGIFMGPLYGSVSAATGSALADLILGMPHYIPATVIIKFLMALTAYYTAGKYRKNRAGITFFSAVPALTVSEFIMAIGYFVYDLILFGIGAAFEWGYFIQIAEGIVIGTPLIYFMGKIKVINNIFQ